MKRRLIAAVLVAVVVAGAAWAWLAGRSRDGAGPVTLYGNVDIRQVQLGFRVGGRIARLEVDEGDSVAGGQVVARLDTRPLEDAVRVAEADVAMSKANAAKMEHGPRPQEIEQAKATVNERRATLANAEQVLSRQSALLNTGNASRQAYDSALAARNEASARLRSAEKALDLQQKGYRTEEVDAALAALAVSEARLEQARTNLADAELKAPGDGILLARVREQGAVVQPGETVLTLSLTKPVWVRAYVPEPLLGRVRPGQAVEVVGDSRPERPYHGKVGYVSPVAEFTPKSVETPELRTDLVYRLRVVVEDDDGSLRQGMPVTVKLAP